MSPKTHRIFLGYPVYISGTAAIKKATSGAAGKDFPQEVALNPLSGLVEYY